MGIPHDYRRGRRDKGVELQIVAGTWADPRGSYYEAERRMGCSMFHVDLSHNQHLLTGCSQCLPGLPDVLEENRYKRKVRAFKRGLKLPLPEGRVKLP